jgi:hypothetical protein
VPFPQPTKTAQKLQFVSIEQLVSLKLDSWLNNPAKRVRDKADVTELILRRRLPLDLSVAPAVRSAYEEIWHALRAES